MGMDSGGVEKPLADARGSEKGPRVYSHLPNRDREGAVADQAFSAACWPRANHPVLFRGGIGRRILI